MIGGIVVALLFWFLPRQAAELVEMRGQLDQLRQSVGQLEQPAPDELQARVEALETGATQGQDLRERVAALETATEGLRAQDVAARITELTAQLQALEERVATIGTGEGGGVAPERVATLENELADLSATVAQLQESVPAGGGQQVAELTSRIEGLEGRLRQAEGAAQQTQALADRLGVLEQQLAAGQQETAGLTDEVVALSGQVGALSTRVNTLGDTVDQLQQQVASQAERRSQGATLAVAVGQLDAALEQGAPFEDVLDGLDELDAEDPVVVEAVAALEPAAASGVPTLAALRSSFDRIANRIVNAAQAPEGAGLLEQAAGNLMSLVTVRPVGADVEGEGAAARVARAEAALDDGDLAKAVAELEALDDGAAAEAAAPWLAEAHARLAAQAALASLQERATLLLTERQ